MKAEDIHLLQLLGQRNTQFIVPVYQRTYDWKMENCRQLLDDIIRVGKDDSIEVHFLGSIVHIKEDEFFQISRPNQLVIIDGQQRITTVSLLFLAMYSYLNNTNDDMNLANKLLVNYLINDDFAADKYNDYYIKLQLTKSDKENYFKLVRKEDIEEFDSNIFRNYIHIYNYIHDLDLDINTLYKGLAKLKIVGISLTKNDRPQAIFESLNSTGLNLTQADLIRNYILMDLDLNTQKEIYERYWFPIEQKLKPVLSEFIRNYLILRNQKIPAISSVYEEFKRTFPKESLNVEETMDQLLTYSKYYEKIIKQSEPDLDINSRLVDIERLNVNVIYPFLLKLYYDYEHGRCTKEEFINVVRLIESYILRRLICGEPTHSLKNIFLSLIKYIDEGDYRASVEKILTSKKGQSRFPNDSEFSSKFIVKDIYNLKSNSRKYIFEKLEGFDNKEIVNIDSCTIEHIMPQTQKLSDKWKSALGSSWKEIHSKYLHSIGNLTLTEHNSEMGDKFFLEKKEICFNKSSIRLNQDLKKVHTWNEEEIVKRAKKLIEWALQIWFYPDVTEETIENSIIYFDEDWTGKKPTSFSFMDEHFKTKGFTDLYRRVIELLYELDEERFLLVIEQEDFRSKRFLSKNKEDFSNNNFSPVADTNIFLNTSLNSNAKKKYLQLILEKFDLDEQDLVIYCEEEKKVFT